jgi:hypothetical protein
VSGQDFAIAPPDQRTTDILMDMLEDILTMPIKRQGLLDMFSGINIVQTKLKKSSIVVTNYTKDYESNDAVLGYF